MNNMSPSSLFLPALLPLLLLLQPSCVSSLFLTEIKRLVSPDPTLAADCPGQCRLRPMCYMAGGEADSDCGGFMQVCCIKPPVSADTNCHTRNDTDCGYIYPPKTNELIDGLTKVTSEENCGRPTVARRRVVNGTDAGFGSYPWQALIRVGASRCGGALIRPDWVVTAAHCVQGAWPGSVKVYLGEYRLYSKREPLPRQKFSVRQIVIHPYYQFTPQADRYDVAVVKLDRPCTYSHHVLPVCLPGPDFPVPARTRAYVTGWGATNPDSEKRPMVLQAVDVNTFNDTKCENMHRDNGITVKIHEEMMCAGHEEGGKDACQGDSGGPLMTKDDSGRWSLIGLVSAGYSCAKPGQPGIYHRVQKTAAWISHVTEKQPADTADGSRRR